MTLKEQPGATVNLTINGKKIKAGAGAMLLRVAREHGIDIPTLCDHEGVEPYGACRLCLAEIKGGGRSRLVAACLYPAEEGLVVETNSEWALATRRGVAELLLARSPNAKAVQEIAARLGIEKPRYPVQEANDCILCGLCVRTCQEVVGVSAISFSNRGGQREMSTPFGEPSPACIGCGSCVYVCPTNFIKMEDVGDTRIFHNWGAKFKLKKCQVCGNYFAPEFQVEYFRKKWNLPQNFYDTCLTCRE